MLIRFVCIVYRDGNLYPTRGHPTWLNPKRLDFTQFDKL